MVYADSHAGQQRSWPGTLRGRPASVSSSSRRTPTGGCGAATIPRSSSHGSWPARGASASSRCSPRQRELTLTERRRNVASAFRATGSAPARVTLVDDIYTTGATANAAASALRKAGAREVEVVTFARTIRMR